MALYSAAHQLGCMPAVTQAGGGVPLLLMFYTRVGRDSYIDITSFYEEFAVQEFQKMAVFWTSDPTPWATSLMASPPCDPWYWAAAASRRTCCPSLMPTSYGNGKRTRIRGHCVQLPCQMASESWRMIHAHMNLWRNRKLGLNTATNVLATTDVRVLQILRIWLSHGRL